MRRTALWILAIVGALLGTVAALKPRRTAKTLRETARRLSQQARYAHGRLNGFRYRLAGRTPDPAVPDDVLADRVRSSLGPLEKRIDTPRVHVLVEDHVVVLHGDVPSKADAVAIEHEVRTISGVRGVESYLHVGLGAGSTRPSVGRAHNDANPSPALGRLLMAAHDTGVATGQERLTVRAVLAAFADRIPTDERSQLLSHLPDDVRELATTPRRYGQPAPRLRTISELVGSIATGAGTNTAHAAAITEGVLGCLRQLVPEEAADVAAVLPEELRELWIHAVPG
jgi:uncharacterized protein (DUF2267 family)